jgi:hypothetical protein
MYSATHCSSGLNKSADNSMLLELLSAQVIDVAQSGHMNLECVQTMDLLTDSPFTLDTKGITLEVPAPLST